MVEDKYMDMKGLIAYSSLSRNTLYGLLKEIPHARIGRKILVKRSDFDGWVRHRKFRAKRAEENMSSFVRQFLQKITEKPHGGSSQEVGR